ncbi:unnamed protein product, partial [Rotaria sordida]
MSTLLGQKSPSHAHGFKMPRKLDIENALGKFDDNCTNSVFTKDSCQTFDSLPLPKKPSDWLPQYKEKGQTYMEFLQLSRTLHTKSSSHRKSIYLTVFGQIDNTIFDIDSLIDYTQRTMNLINGKSRIFNLRTRYSEKPKRSQICVTAILNLFKKIVSDDARYLIALTMYDPYSDDEDLFIAGLSMGNCRVGAFSLYRYDPYLTFNQSD